MAAAPGPIMETRGKFDHTVLIKESNVQRNHGCIYVKLNMLIKLYINSRLTCLLTYVLQFGRFCPLPKINKIDRVKVDFVASVYETALLELLGEG